MTVSEALAEMKDLLEKLNDATYDKTMSEARRIQERILVLCDFLDQMDKKGGK
jgi:hypothetical protein